MDVLSLIGLVVGIAAILAGQYFEGGHITALLNGPALFIVVGGTFGAVMVQTPLRSFLRGFRISVWVFFPPRIGLHNSIDKLISWSKIARKDGLLGLENIEDTEQEPFARKGLQLLIDGSEPSAIRDILHVEIDARERHDLQAARVFESMGGYSPTIGIIAAVLGLIQVMGNLTDPDRLGQGIAIAFVATIYGVGLANLVFLPIANKLKSHISNYSHYYEMITEGLVQIAEGENPRNIEVRLNGYLRAPY